jgi:hypothetical protein
MVFSIVDSFKFYIMDTENNKEHNTRSDKEKSSNKLHSEELVTRVGSTEHNDYRITGSDDNQHKTGSPRNDQGHPEEHRSTAGQ